MSAEAESECERHVLTLEGSITLPFRLIPACPEGFLMGSRGYSANEEPMHRVVIPEDFWMAETPVTQAQFAVWTQQAMIDHKNDHDGPGDLPAENLTWQQAIDYCRWLTENFAEQLPEQCHCASLPTEAHWEYACRGRTHTEYYTGDGNAALQMAGWYDQNSGITTHSVDDDSKRRNRFDLSDMHGNVWEWCLDRWDAAAYRRRWDGITAAETFELNEQNGDRSGDPRRVLRGGSFGDTAFGCRSAFRDWFGAGVRFGNFGFRVCLVRSPLFSQTGEAEPERTALERRDVATGAGSDGEAEILKSSSPGSARGRTAPEAPPPQPCPVP